MDRDLLFLLSVYFIAINIYAFSLMGSDKKRAIRKRRRVPEARLFLVAAALGALGVWLGMRTWRHKTKHASFAAGIPALLVVNAAVIAMLLWPWAGS
ncbi:DUF1294 domain-containing protein [Cohnella algarum]|uniref:DUF1294 domain-containing protein n=1 Tax=Cohnella algarum TaxID=2044859 RepID=UPI0019687506|nr:DUF1294 domain-containing protein [Cohnella algarum]MBN2982567.1 DUF1294 domain-containing protein [Cohnella algarum]